MLLVDILNRVIRPIGAELNRFPNGDLKRRLAALNHYGINYILDVGANTGQYGIQMRRLGYKGKIISFEPLPDAFKKLKASASTDPDWECFNFAIGDEDGDSDLHVSGNSTSSSVLEMMPLHAKAAPQSAVIKKIPVKMRRLDSVLLKEDSSMDRTFLKIDVQGFEKSVLDGAVKTLESISFLQLELSIMELYKGSLKYSEMIQFLASRGFDLFGLEPGFSDPATGRLLQFDGIFVKKFESSSLTESRV